MLPPEPATIVAVPSFLDGTDLTTPVMLFIELEGPCAAPLIDPVSVTAGLKDSEARAIGLATPTVVGDFDRDGVPDRMVAFSPATLIAALGGAAGKLELDVKGTAGACKFEGPAALVYVPSVAPASSTPDATPEPTATPEPSVVSDQPGASTDATPTTP